jgi:hypothetical protein
MRGRNGGGNNNNNNNNNNRRGPNPLNRNYESNGPDVKIRGSAQQIAEKYAALARDAMSSGDRVMAENYLQHAEHYNRIIAAAQAQMPIQHQQQNRDDFDEDLDEDREDFENGAANGEAQIPAVNHGAGPQPVIEGTPAEVALNGENGREGNGGGREGRDGNRHHRDRRHNNGYGQNGQRNEFSQRGEQGNRDEQNRQREEAAAVQVDNAAVAATPAQPQSFNPAAIAAQADQNGADRNGAEQNDAAPTAEVPRRARRPRKPRVVQEGAGVEGAESSADAGEPASAEG